MPSSSAPLLLSLVIPMYNEEEGIDDLFSQVLPILESIDPAWEIVCVDDGSTDNTWAHLTRWREKEPRIRMIRLSRNFGKEAATTAGLDLARGQAVVPFDADLQDPPDVIPEMLAKWREGYTIVLAARRRRDGDSWLKRRSAHWFYRIINRLAPTPIPENVGDFRLLDRQALEVIGHCRERTRFMKGLLAWPGFNTATIYFDRHSRRAGDTSWNPVGLWNFALDGIFSFSNLPLKIWTYLGAVISLISFGYASFLILRTLLVGADVPGYPSLMVVILFLGGIQLMSIGIIGEYVARIYRETKRRPIYVISEGEGVEITLPHVATD